MNSSVQLYESYPRGTEAALRTQKDDPLLHQVIWILIFLGVCAIFDISFATFSHLEGEVHSFSFLQKGLSMNI